MHCAMSKLRRNYLHNSICVAVLSQNDDCWNLKVFPQNLKLYFFFFFIELVIRFCFFCFFFIQLQEITVRHFVF